MKKNPRIMVTDDEEEIRHLLKRILELEGYDVVLASDGNAALATMKECELDLIILDIMMPGLNGFQVIDLIRQHSDVPIIMLTGKCEVTSVSNALGLGADDYVRKPFRTRELLARIRSKLRRTNPQLIISEN